MAGEEKIKQMRPLSDRTMCLLLALARILPRRFGYALAEGAGRLYGRLAPRARGIVESNLAAVIGTDDPRPLREKAIQVFGHASRQYYEMFYLPTLSREEIASMIEFGEASWQQFIEAYRQGKGLILVAPHQSSFDVAGQAVRARTGYPMLVLALPDQAEGFAFLNRLRTFQGVRVLPVGPRAVREAVRALRNGEIVVTGADRPVKGQGTIVEFFGRPTLLPDGAVRLALYTHAALLYAYCRREEGTYRVDFELLEVVRSGDERTDIQENVQQIARVMEKAIRAHPEQWHLFQRLWDD